ncbi:MAG TPA: hypothetical protein PKD72_14580, partial [Gemmatales bacterium]|nr:hypothetical protein [Gemmatales bacterium]
MYSYGIFSVLLLCCMVSLISGQEAVPSSPALPYALTSREGPYLIHIGSFQGDEALEYATRFAEETRSKHKYQTYLYSLGDDQLNKDREELRQSQLKMVGSDKLYNSDEKQKFKTLRVLKEYSVFVGSFPDIEKARIESVRIKELPPPSSIPQSGVHLYSKPTGRVTEDPDAGKYGIFGKRLSVQSEEGKRLKDSAGNPYRQAFVVKNPLLSNQAKTATVQQSQAMAFDPAWKELNEKEPYSIFTCPKPWTIVVAKFTPPGAVQSSMKPSVVQAGFNPSAADLGKGLERAAETARQLAHILRDGGKGHDAYVFHTREYSIVTVGAFEHRFDPNMERAWTILKQFAEQHQGKT